MTARADFRFFFDPRPRRWGSLQRAGERGDAEGRFGRESQSVGFILMRSCFYMGKVSFMGRILRASATTGGGRPPRGTST